MTAITCAGAVGNLLATATCDVCRYSEGKRIIRRALGGWGKKTADLMRERCPACIESFSERMGSGSVKGIESLVPGRILKARSGHLGLLQSEWMSWRFRLYDDLDSEQTLVLRNKDLNLCANRPCVERQGD